jgi:hypothetical protein
MATSGSGGQSLGVRVGAGDLEPCAGGEQAHNSGRGRVKVGVGSVVDVF